MSSPTDQKIKEAPQKPPDQLTETLDKVLEKIKAKEAPQISDILEKAKAAVSVAQKAKQKKLLTWKCTECGSSGIQLYLNNCTGPGGSHFRLAVDAETMQFCDDRGNPITDGCQKKTLKTVLEGNSSARRYLPVRGAKL